MPKSVSQCMCPYPFPLSHCPALAYRGRKWKPPILFACSTSGLQRHSASEINDSNAMALANVGCRRPSVGRMVLLKGHGPDADGIGGFIFTPTWKAAKRCQWSERGQVALLFHWKSLRRQIRIEGVVGCVDDATADAYFATRSRNSQLGAWASDQSQPLDSRATFEARFAAEEARFSRAGRPAPAKLVGL